jgi:hypothetical protein
VKPSVINYLSVCRQTSKAAALAAQQQQQQAAQAAAAAAAAAQVAAAQQVVLEGPEEMGGEVQVDDWQPDPNEPRYCLCNQVSYGEMVGCDNEDVSYQQSLNFIWIVLISYPQSLPASVC